MGEFMAIRMIVVNPDRDKEEFRKWMTEGTSPFIETMGNVFAQDGLEEIIFLEGNKENARQSYQGSGNGPEDSTPAGANADFAWITRWTSKADNQKAWSDNPVKARPQGWGTTWKEFLAWCHPRRLSGAGNPHRPEHGPPYDFYGAPGPGSTHYGRGAGCLVEGFVVVAVWSPGGFEVVKEYPPPLRPVDTRRGCLFKGFEVVKKWFAPRAKK